MSKPMYRLVDGKGRVLIPKSMREAAKLEYGDIVCLGMAGGKITVRKVEVIEVGDQSPEAVEAYVRTAFQFMPDSLRLDLIGELSILLHKKEGYDQAGIHRKGLYADRKGGIYPEPGGGSSLKGITRALHRAAFFLYEYPENRKSQTLHCPSGFPIYWGGMALLEQGCGWCAAARTVGGKGTTPALPDPSIWGAGFTWTFP